jgi:hypothetical protein
MFTADDDDADNKKKHIHNIKAAAQLCSYGLKKRMKKSLERVGDDEQLHIKALFCVCVCANEQYVFINYISGFPSR